MIYVCIAALIVLLIVQWYLFPMPKVHGDSMYPTLKEGQILLATRAFSRKKIKSGDIYVFRSPEREKTLLIKRLEHTLYRDDRNRNTICYFVGDNLGNSNDSRYFGYVPMCDVVAKIIYPKFIEKEH